MFATSKVIEAARKDRNRFLANPRGEGYLTRDERWREAIAYCRRREARLMDIDAVLAAEVEAERAIRAILIGLQLTTGRVVEWVKVETGDVRVTVNTVSK